MSRVKPITAEWCKRNADLSGDPELCIRSDVLSLFITRPLSVHSWSWQTWRTGTVQTHLICRGVWQCVTCRSTWRTCKRAVPVTPSCWWGYYSRNFSMLYFSTDGDGDLRFVFSVGRRVKLILKRTIFPNPLRFVSWVTAIEAYIEVVNCERFNVKACVKRFMNVAIDKKAIDLSNGVKT